MKNMILILLVFAGFIQAVYAEDSVRIISISPSAASPLYVGQFINFEVEVEYTLESTDSASITLVIQQAESGHMPLANEFDVVLKGNGSLKLSKELTVPSTKALKVFTPLTPEGEEKTKIVKSKLYKVIGS